tara:strand:+ start:2123 stop:2365 length:243 start_codon:yes stop_codon:yes gene_type:complete
MDDIKEDERQLIKISMEIMDLTIQQIEDGATPMQIAGCLMATASRMYQETLSEEEWLALMESVIDTTTGPDKRKSLETLH